mgnify:FL=1
MNSRDHLPTLAHSLESNQVYLKLIREAYLPQEARPNPLGEMDNCK